MTTDTASAGAGGDPPGPSWGEPELYMSLAWSYLNRTTRDLEARTKRG